MPEARHPDMPSNAPALTPVQWLICIIAAIGFAFDTYELLMLPLIIRPALIEFGLRPGTADFSRWASLLFWVPAFAGGIFGLLGGYLTDILGRRRVLTWSILLYAFSAFLGGFATSPGTLLLFRSLKFVGVCIEFVAAVAWLAELFQDPHLRERVLGYTQAFSSIGGIMVVWANSLAIKYGPHLPAVAIPAWLNLGPGAVINDANAAWRYTMMSGLIPAIPLIIIRPFLPESPIWRQKREAGTLRRPSILQLFSPDLRRTTIVTTIMFACSLGAAFGAIQQMPQIIPACPDVQHAIQEEIAKLPPRPSTRPSSTTPASPGAPAIAAPPDPRAVAKRNQIAQEYAANAAKFQEYGGLLGRILLAVLAVRIASRRALIRIFQIPGLIIIPVVFAYIAPRDYDALKIGMFFAGLVTVGQLSFWGNYLPRVYPVHLRGTGESFAANIGGRMIGTCFAALTIGLAGALTPEGSSAIIAAKNYAYTSAAVGFAVFLIGFIASFFLPEPGLEKMAE